MLRSLRSLTGLSPGSIIRPDWSATRAAKATRGLCGHVAGPIMASDKQRLEDTAGYLVRNPSLKKLVYLDGQQAAASRRPAFLARRRVCDDGTGDGQSPLARSFFAHPHAREEAVIQDLQAG